jgi:hypothetical protein
VPVIVWESNGRPVLMNDYEDPEYLHFFPYYGKGGHIPGPDEGHTPVSLDSKHGPSATSNHDLRRRVILSGRLVSCTYMEKTT